MSTLSIRRWPEALCNQKYKEPPGLSDLRLSPSGCLRAPLLSGTAAVALLLGCPNAAFADGPTTSFTVTGNVLAPQTFNLVRLQALPAVTENVSFLAGNSTTSSAFTGVPLFSLLNDTVGIKTDPSVKQDLLRNVVIATGSDGYQSTYAL